jgi:hypothetical protein
MAWRQHPRKARTDATAPQAWATCDKCGFIANLVDLRWQWDWAGLQLINKKVLVCDSCYDIPQRQLGTIILPPDPVGVLNARVEAYPADESWPRLLQNGAPRYMQTKNGTQQAFARQLQYSKYFS